VPEQASGHVVVVGNLTIDDVVRPDGRTSMGTLGGNSVHAAVAAHANGARTSLVARKGDDFPDHAVSRLSEAGIDLRLVPVAGPTVRNWVIYEDDGRRHWCYRTHPSRGSDVAPVPSDLPADLLADSRVVHIAAMPLPAAELLVDHVRATAPSALVTMDTHEDWVEQHRDRLMALARRVDVFVPSADELAALTGESDPADGIAHLAGQGLRCAIAKAGADGAYVLDHGTVLHVAAPQVRVEDATGAGDSFCGAVAAGLSSGMQLRDAARLGCATAATAIQSSGSLRLLQLRADPGVLRDTARRLVVAPVATRSRSTDDARYSIDVMQREIAMIPEVMAQVIADEAGAVDALADQLVAAGVEHLWLTGCGDSAFAGTAAALALQRHGRLTPHPVHALDLARYAPRYVPPSSAVIALSFSGRVGRTVEAASQARRYGHPVVALTNDPDGPLAQASDQVLPISVPTLGFSPGTSSYVAMVATLVRLAVALARDRGDSRPLADLSRIHDLAVKSLVDCAGPAEAAATIMLPATWVSFLGAGPNEATARFGAAKLFEGPQRLGVATNTEEWAHEQYFVTRPGDPVVLIAPTGASRDRAMDILAELCFIGARPIVISDTPLGGEAHVTHVPYASDVSEDFSPLLTCLPLALIAFHLARLSGKRSYNFRNEEARHEHYQTIHKVSFGEPA
jgi:sugar/nucleoside kinase (ribokinase family)/fructoselysine-6-P-deglycase FrlB-like protein